MAHSSEPARSEPLRLVVDTRHPVVSVPATVPVITPGLARALARLIHHAADLNTGHDTCPDCDLSSQAS